MARSKRLIKILVALGALVGLAFLFVRSAREERTKPYTVEAAQMRGWTVELEQGAGPSGPLLVLRTPPDLPSGLFRQVFKRAMESLNGSGMGIPLLLQGEFDRAFAGRTTPEALLASARAAGLDAAGFAPRCLGHRRLSQMDSSGQLFFVIFDAPAFVRFRQQLAASLGDTPRADYDPAALSPVLLVAATEPSFTRWLPLRANPDADCVSGVVIK